MVEEENKAGTKPGKHTERLGAHRVLIGKVPYSHAVNGSLGKKMEVTILFMRFQGF